jgi:pimeloyl-ACP methyl ester carboxylesterase
MITKNLQEPTLKSFKSFSPAGEHRLAFWEWESTSKTAVVCAHGLSRNGRDFDVLANALLPQFKVFAIDVVGRGQSDWLKDPSHYQFTQYVHDATIFLDHLKTSLGIERVIWIGTSMGGILGMLLANVPVVQLRALVINDIGPVLGQRGISRIAAYVGTASGFTSFEAAREAVIANSASFGEHTDEQWDLFVRHFVVERGDRWEFNYDPAIAHAFKLASAAPSSVNLWPQYDAIKCPTLVLRGADSDLFESAVAQEMTQRGPKATLVEFPHVGHAPTLMSTHQIEPILSFTQQFLLPD